MFYPIENLGVNWGYNIAADSLNWSNINMNLLLKLTKNFNLQTNFTFDPYTYQLNSYGNPVRVNVPRWKVGKGLGRLSSTGTSLSYTFNNDTFKKLFKKGDDKDDDSTNPNINELGEPITDIEELARLRERQSELKKENGDNEKDEESEMKDGYLKWKIPWSLSINYSINYGYGDFNKEKLEYNGRLTQNLSFS